MIDLALELQKITTLREPLNNFKYVAQHSNINSLENVLDYFMDQSKKKNKSIANQATQQVSKRWN